MQNWALSYQEVKSLPAESGGCQVWLSPSLIDPCWDDFLQRTAWGQFQQASRWAEYKSHDGWHHHRVVITGTHGIVGGFQILWRKIRLLRVGYVSKGPVLAGNASIAPETATDLICKAIAELGLHALILQPPDEGRMLVPILARHGFLPNRIKAVIRATLMVNLADGMAGVTKHMSATARSEVSQAKRRGTVIRDGGSEDIGRFFAMIRTTCLRQETKPSPASEMELRQLWDSFQPLGIKLMIAQCRGVDVAGQLCIPFGDRVTIWKKGWTGQHRDGHPNRLLNHAGLEWACSLGRKYWDYVALDEAIATTLLAGKSLTTEQKQSRHMFHLGFGGEPRLIPESFIWIENPILRIAYGMALKIIHR